MPPLMLERATPQSRVKHSTTALLSSLEITKFDYTCFKLLKDSGKIFHLIICFGVFTLLSLTLQYDSHVVSI